MFSATVKSHSSNWLHRLWLSKGFSPCTDLDLDQFITALRHDSYETVHPTSPQNPLPMNAQQTFNIQAPDGFTRITNLLSDLFCVGDPIPNSFPGRKCPRKQPNPRHHLVSKSSDESLSTMSDHNSGVGLLKEMTLQDDQVKLVENIKCTDEEEEGYLSLDGFSITEVTVIDTSFAGWKFEKMLFRKNDTWKATDKKGKATMTLGKKKKKKRNALVMAKEKSQRKKLKVLPLGSSMLKKGGSGCNEEEHVSGDKLQVKVKVGCTKASGGVDKSYKKQRATK